MSANRLPREPALERAAAQASPPRLTRSLPLATRKTSAATKKPKSAATKKSTQKANTKTLAKRPKVSDAEVTIDRRRKVDRRDASADEATVEPAKPTPLPLKPRAKVQRRRQIDPTTCERDYSDAEVQFMGALDDYKRANGRMFPTCSEVLEVIRDLGYVQLTPAELAAREGMEAAAQNAESLSSEPDPQKAFATAAEAHLVR